MKDKSRSIDLGLLKWEDISCFGHFDLLKETILIFKYNNFSGGQIFKQQKKEQCKDYLTFFSITCKTSKLFSSFFCIKAIIRKLLVFQRTGKVKLKVN